MTHDRPDAHPDPNRCRKFTRCARRLASGSQSINAMCTVFAESEVISATARGVDRAELARGLHEAVARRAVSLLRRLPLESEIVFCGGGALNGCLHELIAQALGGGSPATGAPIVAALGANVLRRVCFASRSKEVRLPPAPQIVAALGAALSVEGQDGSTRGCPS